MKPINYKQLVVVTLLGAIFASIAIGIVSRFFLVEYSVNQISKEQSKKISRLAFELIYAGMEKGWSKADFEKLADHLSIIEPGLKIHIYRNEKLVEMFGELESDKTIKANDPKISKALEGNEVLISSSNDSKVRYLYPVIAAKSCIKCHTNVSEGYINGIIDISYTNYELKNSFSNALGYLVLFFVLFFIAVFFGLYANLDRYFINPLKNLSNGIREIMASNDLEKSISLGSRIREIVRLESHFNNLIINIREHSQQREKMLLTDALTGLPNRFKLKEDIKTYKYPVAIILNIDSFKEINDLYGVKIGDFVLQEFANTIITYFNKNETLYRFAGDEYCILIEYGKIENGDIDSYTHKLLDIIKKSVFIYNEYEIIIDVTAGASKGFESIMERADIALKVAKKQKRDFLIYSENLQITKQYEYNIKWTKILKNAIESNRIRVYYQPIINNKTKEVEKYETLLRLIEEDGRVISPGFFLDVAKKTKIYPHLTKIVIKNAFRAFAFTNYQFSINLSIEDALNEEIRELIFAKLSSFHKPKNVIFEITEGEGIENYAEISEFVNKLRSFGAQIAIDDFGTGYSNFAHILKLAVNIIKLDATLVKNMDTDRNSAMIIKTIVSFCKEMEIQTVAEYVHNESIYNKACELEIDYSQGYYFGEPLESI